MALKVEGHHQKWGPLMLSQSGTLGSFTVLHQPETCNILASCLFFLRNGATQPVAAQLVTCSWQLLKTDIIC